MTRDCSPTVVSIRVECGPMIESAPIRVAPRSEVPGSIVASAAISTSASIQVEPRVDDRHPGEHVALEDLAAGLGRRQRRGRRGC